VHTRGRQLLVVDDDPGLLRMLRRGFVLAGSAVGSSCSSSAAAIRARL